MKKRNIFAIAGALLMIAPLAGCAAKGDGIEEESNNGIYAELPAHGEENPAVEETPGIEEFPEIEKPSQTPETEEPPEVPEVEEPPEVPAEPKTEEPPKAQTVSYICVTSGGVNIRSGAGTGYSVLGTAEKSTLYALLGEVNGWYKTNYKNKTVYISKNYCRIVEMEKGSERIEEVIAEGAKLLGTPYVYGATRLHDGKGNMYKGFTTNAFDCSSLMQYMFYKGADKLLDVNTRTQIYQGTTVQKSQLKRGDLIFFTNSSRKDNKGIERVGHVAMYLGDNYILHTASDYAKIEQISSLRWSYYIQTQRMI